MLNVFAEEDSSLTLNESSSSIVCENDLCEKDNHNVDDIIETQIQNDLEEDSSLTLNESLSTSTCDSDLCENDDSIEAIFHQIPISYDVDLTEEDYIRNEKDNHSVEDLIETQIQSVLEEQNFHIQDVGYTMHIEPLFGLEDYTIHDYKVVFHQEEDHVSKEIMVSVQYQNSDSYNEEDKESIDEWFQEEEVIHQEQYYDFYTEEFENDVISMDDYLKDSFAEADFDYYYEYDHEEVYDLSYREVGYTYFFKNSIFYRQILTLNDYVSNIHVISELTQSDVLDEVIEKYQDSYDTTLSFHDLDITEDGEVTYEKEDYSFGKIQVTELEPEEVQSYAFSKGEDSSFVVGEDSQLTLQTNGSYQKFIKLNINGVRVNSKYYDISKDNVITLKNDYLRTLNKQKYDIEVVYSDGKAKTTFTLEEGRVDTEPVYYPVVYYPHYEESSYYSVPLEEVNIQEEVKEEEKEASNIIDTVIDKKDEVKTIEVEEEPEDEKALEKEDKKKNINYIPIVVVLCAFAFGSFGGLLYKKSLED